MSLPAHPTKIRAEGNDDAMRQTLYEFCCRNNKDLLLLQWDAEKNAPLTPQQVTAGTLRKAWWKCPLGHSYSAVISSRALRGSDCPYCAGSKALAGFNDLAAKAPDMAAQWHPALNGNLTPEMVTPGSHRRVWWQCSLGHTWKAFVYSRAGEQKCGCPVCGGSLDGARRARYEQSLRETAGVCDTDAPP